MLIRDKQIEGRLDSLAISVAVKTPSCSVSVPITPQDRFRRAVCCGSRGCT